MSNLTLTEPSVNKKIYQNPLFGDKVIFLKTSRESGGECTLMDLEVAAYGGNTLHTHETTSETFTVVEGNLEVRSGKKRYLLQAGESFTVPPKTVHCFRNPSNQTTKFLVEFRPGHEGFENCLKIAYGLAGDGLTNKKSIPKKFSHLAVVVSMGEGYPTGILRLLKPIFVWRARKARAQGIEQELVNKYCR